MTDAAGNTSALSDTYTIRVDTLRPGVESITGEPITEQNGPFDLTVTFSEPVFDFEAGDVRWGTFIPEPETPEPDSQAVLFQFELRQSTDGDKEYQVRITPMSGIEGSIEFTINAQSFGGSLPADGVSDAVGNPGIGSETSDPVHVDTIVPTVESITPPSTPPSGEQNSPFDVTITFSEDVNDFTTADLTVTGEATATAVTAVTAVSGTEKYRATATITPNTGVEGEVTVTVKEGAVTDNAENPNTASAATSNIHIDTIVPTVVISDVPDIEKNVPYDLTVTFSEPVNGFSVPADLTLGLTTEPGVISATPIAAATLASGEDGDSVYTVTITPNASGAEGDVTVTVNAGAAQDPALNDNTASAVTPAIHIDTIVPTVAISDVPLDMEKNVPFDLTVRFSEPVKGFAVTDDLTVTLTSEPDVTSATPIAAVMLKSGVEGAAEYVVTVTPNAAGAEGNVTVTVNANTVQDFATNANPAASNAASVHIDTIAPTVAVSGFPPVTPEQNGPFTLTVTFSEPVKGFSVTDDLTVTLTPEPGVTSATPIATAALTLGADGEAVYTVTITPNAAGAEGDVTVTVNATTVQDFALNANPAASPETTSVHVDTIVPTVSVSGFPPVLPEQNGPFTLTVTFSEEVNGFAVPGDLTVGLVAEPGVSSASPIAAATLASGADGAAVYTVTITPNAAGAEGDVTVTVNADRVQDFALNDNTASPETDVVHVDTISPTVSLVVTPPVTVGEGTDYPTEERNAPYTLTVTFSEPVNGFAVPGDLTITGPGTAELTGGVAGTAEYTVTITPNATSEDDVTVTVNPTTVADFATNGNPAGSSAVAVHIDTRPPTFTIEDTPVLQRRNDFFDIRVVFLEPVNDFEVEDFTFTLPDLVTATFESGADGAETYTIRMTPNENVQGDLIIQINAESLQDFALNFNAAPVATTQPVRIDTIAPTVEITDLPTGVKNEAFDVTIAFAEVVNGFTTQDIVLVGPATVALTAGTDGDAIYTAQVTPNPNAMGNVTLQIPAAVVMDLAENVNLASLLTPPIAIDTNALTVELQDVPETVQLEAFSVMIVFSNDVNGFVLADIEIPVMLSSKVRRYSARGTPIR